MDKKSKTKKTGSEKDHVENKNVKKEVHSPVQNTKKDHPVQDRDMLNRNMQEHNMQNRNAQNEERKFHEMQNENLVKTQLHAENEKLQGRNIDRVEQSEKKGHERHTRGGR